MNVASRVVIAAAALGAPDKAPKPRPKGRKVRTVEGALVDPEVYEDLMKFEDRLKAPVRRAIDGE